jgi:hypothetical protein
MAKPNYSFEKRQRELARKKKQEEKRLRHARAKAPEAGTPGESSDTGHEGSGGDAASKDDSGPGDGGGTG